MYVRCQCVHFDFLILAEFHFPVFPASSAHKKKSKKKSKPSTTDAPASVGKGRTVDRGFLCCTHHEVMVAGLALLGAEAIKNKGKPLKCETC